MTELILFASSALVVFALGLQQLNVQGNHYILAILTSYAIGALNLFIWHAVPNMTWSQIAATLNGGPVGIVAAMWAHPRLVRVLRLRKA
jgi:hypothetical protein